jgi:ABC-type multidrug transport system fused ATPase/permease subunit
MVFSYSSIVRKIEPVLFSGSVCENIMKGRASSDKFSLTTLEEADTEKKKTTMTASTTNTTAYQSVPGDVEMGVVYTSSCRQEGVDADVVNSCIASNAHEFISSFPQVLIHISHDYKCRLCL